MIFTGNGGKVRVCLHLCWGVHGLGVLIYACGGWRPTSSVFLGRFLPSLGDSVSWIWSSLTGYPGWPTRPWGASIGPPECRFLGTHWHLLFTSVLRIWTLVFMLAPQSFYQLTHLPRRQFLVFKTIKMLSRNVVFSAMSRRYTAQQVTLSQKFAGHCARFWEMKGRNLFIFVTFFCYDGIP